MPSVRVACGSAYNTRVSAVNASDSTSGYIGVGVIGLMVIGKTTQSTDKDARLVNCFQTTVSDPVTGKRRIYTVKRPGFSTQDTPQSGSVGVAILVWTGQGMGLKRISAFGTAPSTIYDGTTSLGSITGKAMGISETFVGTTATLTVASDDNTGWYYDTITAVMTKIADADFPGNSGKTLVGNFVHMDGYAAIMTKDAQVWASDLNSVTSWTATSFDTAGSYPDQGVGLARSKNYILAFGTESVQFFYNAGLTPFPFAKATAMTVKVGAVSYDAIAQISDTVFWAGSTPQGSISVFQYDGSINRISPPEVDASILLAGASNISLTSIRFYGRSFVLVRAGPTTWAYCVEEKTWHEWNSTVPLWYKCAALSVGGTMVTYTVSNSTTNGKVYVQNPASLVFTDDGAAYTARVQLPTMDLGSDRMKRWQDVSIIGDTETTSSLLTVSFSDDDFQTYHVHGNIDLNLTRKYASRFGSSRKRGWVLTHSAATPMRLEALELGVELGDR